MRFFILNSHARPSLLCDLVGFPLCRSWWGSTVGCTPLCGTSETRCWAQSSWPSRAKLVTTASLLKVRPCVSCVPCACVVVRHAPPGHGRRADPDAKFCIKKANKECVRKKCTLDGAPCSEDFIREMKVLKYLSDPGHPNIVRYLCMYEDDENYYALMEYIEGARHMLHRFAALP